MSKSGQKISQNAFGKSRNIIQKKKEEHTVNGHISGALENLLGQPKGLSSHFLV